MTGLELSIDRVTRSRRNLFTSVRLDRLVEVRDDHDWLRGILADDRARFVPLWRGRNLLAGSGDGQIAVYLDASQIPENTTEPVPTLLGTDGKRYFFAVSVDDAARERILAELSDSAFVDLRLASVDMDAKHAGVLAYAKALLYWQYRHRYCGLCGSPNSLKSAGHKLICGNARCRKESFPRIDPAIIVLVTQADACLLGRNASWPQKRFSTLAGFVEPGESLEDAVVREVYEESRVRLKKIRYLSSQPWPFPSSAMCGFHAEAVDRECSAADEMEELRWITAASLEGALRNDEIRLPPPVSIAFQLIADWYRQYSGEDLERLVRAAGSWLSRKGLK
ncbi:MAG: NAD(+) diphosphatase [Xanthomonadales bacterium]|nr:NAD(+) diphosphatase [Gammaproteobacteria bacterium]MBT8064900.1 NAD(+) diphosphatase [Gammaproteobacteria bacterium]NNK33907.1 NAD(+) diphosphatase [Xanthomonadales bacterium]NNK38330.1 NAD(+) diphosphatase [Xanthomonadales bacterium]